MAHRFAETAFTPAVRDFQTKAGSRTSYAAMDLGEDSNHLISEREASFIRERDSFYIASVGETGWPYVQHRGGPQGFMKVLDERRIGFADYSGNRQYVTTGNVSNDNRVSLFFMDYPNRRRLKLLGRIETVDAGDRETLTLLEDPAYLAAVERGFVVHIEAFDWNCPQHITPRYTEAEVRAEVLPGLQRVLTGKAVAHAEVAASGAQRSPSPDSVLGDGPLQLVVAGMRQLTPHIRSFELRAPGAGKLPLFTAGAHLRIPMRLHNGSLAEREYSITSDPAIRDRYDIAVLNEADGRGGSVAVHETFALGTNLSVDAPINLFPLHSDHRPAVLIAGGIGITPIRAMAAELGRNNVAFKLHYAGRSRSEMAFVGELETQYGDNVSVYAGDSGSRLDPEAILADAPESMIYVCGPPRLIEGVIQAAKRVGVSVERIRFERFT